MKILLYLIITALTLPLALAHPQIIAVNYDPIGADHGKEWLQLYNPTNNTIDLSNYIVQAGNGRHHDDQWATQWSGQYLLPPHTTFLVSEYAPADVVKSLTLQNGPDALRIIDQNGSVIDLVGWGDHEFPTYYYGQPVEAKGDGWSVRRHCTYNAVWQCQHTYNNSADFEPYYNLTPYTFSHAQPTNITVALPAATAHITDISMTDDQPNMTGTQLLPTAAPRVIHANYTLHAFGNATVLRTITLPDNTTKTQTIDVYCDGTCKQHDQFLMPAYPQAGTYTLSYAVDNNTAQHTFIVQSYTSITAQFSYNLSSTPTHWHLGTLHVENSQPTNAKITFASNTLSIADHIIIGNTTISHGNAKQFFINGAQQHVVSIPRTTIANATFVGKLWVDIS